MESTADMHSEEVLAVARAIDDQVITRGYAVPNAFRATDPEATIKHLYELHGQALRGTPPTLVDAAARVVWAHIDAARSSNALHTADTHRGFVIEHCASGMFLASRSFSGSFRSVDANTGHNPFRDRCEEHWSPPPWRPESEDWPQRWQESERYTGMGVGTWLYRSLASCLPESRFEAGSLRVVSLTVRNRVHADNPWAWETRECPVCSEGGMETVPLPWRSELDQAEFNSMHAALGR